MNMKLDERKAKLMRFVTDHTEICESMLKTEFMTERDKIMLSYFAMRGRDFKTRLRCRLAKRDAVYNELEAFQIECQNYAKSQN
jgi:hypothetical protein